MSAADVPFWLITLWSCVTAYACWWMSTRKGQDVPVLHITWLAALLGFLFGLYAVGFYLVMLYFVVPAYWRGVKEQCRVCTTNREDRYTRDELKLHAAHQRRQVPPRPDVW